MSESERENIIESLGQGGRGAAWVALYLICWILMAWSCSVGLPSDCLRAEEPTEVLIELSVLVCFALAQAVFCGILKTKRFEALTTKRYFPAIIFVSGIFISACSLIEDLRDLRERPGKKFSSYQVMVSVVLIMVAVCGVLWHFAEAWKLLPGARMISGQASDAVPPFREDRLIHNPLRDYMVTRGLVVLYAMLLSAFSFAKGDGWGYHYILLAWMMSLLSRFTSRVSVVWLALTTSVFLQGIGAYGLYFLRSPDQWPDFDDDSSDD